MSSEDEKRECNKERSTEELEGLLAERLAAGKPTRLIEEELRRRRREGDGRGQEGHGDLSEHHWR